MDYNHTAPHARISFSGDAQANGDIMANHSKDVDHPPYGGKGGFRKVTLTLTPEAYEQLIRESTRRKIAQEPNGQLSAVLREAIMDYLRRTNKQPEDN